MKRLTSYGKENCLYNSTFHAEKGTLLSERYDFYVQTVVCFP